MPSLSFVYIAASDSRRLVIGITKDLEVTMELLRTSTTGWAVRRAIHKLVWFKECSTMREALALKHRLVRMGPQHRGALIGEKNPEWKDLVPGKAIWTHSARVELDNLYDLVERLKATLRDAGIDPDDPGPGGVGAIRSGWPDFPRPRAGSDAAPWPISEELQTEPRQRSQTRTH